ncbi:MBL fold metallo-hydrolase [Mycolicibacterium sp.]|uniref:MBL fold metallo-hydrolase n=1 Tax=Mycolicibacterium sp. TaxID=2320850 RepID=UPI001A1F5FB6|nr:MBL fold metallo-hydrolase [Mycolicibacterium sp.]MBJ7336515.1 MBL fold metallo-hydrolase [Mycolicibacterium sp.]
MTTMKSSTLEVGDLEIVQILDGEWITPLPPGVAEMDSEVLAEHSDYLLPGGRMSAALGAFLVRTGDQVVLIDAGLGPSAHHEGDEHQDSPSGFSAEKVQAFFREKGAPEAQVTWFLEMLSAQSLQHGLLGENLTKAGVRPDEITDVVLSHLHPDHMGWVARGEMPFFPKAKLWAHQADVDLFLGDTAPDETTFKIMLGVDSTKERMMPVHDQIHPWSSDRTIAPGIDLRWLPGHTPGSSIAVVSSGEDRAMILGDVIHCPLELVDDDFAIMADIDPAMAKRSKDVLRQELEDSTVHASSSHFPGLQFGRLVKGQGRRHWSWSN